MLCQKMVKQLISMKKKGRTTTIKYYFKDDIVYKQDAVYTINPKEMGKTEEEIQKNS